MKRYIKKIQDGNSRIKAIKQIEKLDKTGYYIFLMGLIMIISYFRNNMNSSYLFLTLLIMSVGILIRLFAYDLLEKVKNVRIYKNFIYEKDEKKHLNILNESKNIEEFYVYYQDNFN